MKKIIILGGLLGGLLCSCNNQTINKENTLIKENTNFKNMYNYSAISGISLLSQKTNKHKRFLNEEEQNEIIENLKLVENWLSESRFEFLDSDKEEYTVKYQIDTSFLNEKNVYTFYYNETLKEEEEYFIEGIVEFNNEIYSMYGKKEIEDDEQEIEFKISLNENTYVVLEQEVENNEQEYSYKYYENNKKIYQTELEFEDNEITFKEKNSEGKKKYSFKFINDHQVKAKIKINEETFYLLINIELNELNEKVYTIINNESNK